MAPSVVAASGASAPSASINASGVAGAVTSVGRRNSSCRRGSEVVRKTCPRSYAPRSRTSSTAWGVSEVISSASASGVSMALSYYRCLPSGSLRDASERRAAARRSDRWANAPVEDGMSLVQRFATTFNARDVDGLLACFTERASYTDNFFGEHSGRDALRAMFERMFREGRDYVWRMESIVETPVSAAAEWTFSYVVTEAGPRSAGREVRFRGMSIFELDGGRIARYREYFDTGVALLQLGFAPEALAKVLSRRIS